MKCEVHDCFVLLNDIGDISEVTLVMCDEFICSDAGVELCDDDRKLLEGLGKQRKNVEIAAKKFIAGDDKEIKMFPLSSIEIF